MSDSERTREIHARRNDEVTLDGNVRITQLGNSETTLMKMFSHFFFIRAVGVSGREAKANNRFSSFSTPPTQITKYFFFVVCFQKRTKCVCMQRLRQL